ncbi:MAG: chemotaxis protein CheB [Pseudonocardiaceae bacterium]
MKPDQRLPVVALVCSHGGLNALIHVLSPLRTDFPGAVIVLQHHSPTTESALAQILGRNTTLPVSWAHDGAPLIPGRVIVAPPGSHTLVTGCRTIALIQSGERPPYRPSADLLLTTLALAMGPQAIAVVLSGYGVDGATGATAIHRFGGQVIASDAATSEIFSMPEATITRDNAIDHVLAVREIAELLTELADQ